MQETTEQYVARISGYVQGKNHFKVLQTTAGKLTKQVRQATRNRLLKTSESGKWSVVEILAHLAESELVIAYRLRLVLAANGTPIQAFDQNQWQSNAGYLRKNPRRSLELFKTLRDSNIALLKSLTKEKWDYYGMHQERGRESIVRMVEMYSGHDVNHLNQIEAILRGKKK